MNDASSHDPATDTVTDVDPTPALLADIEAQLQAEQDALLTDLDAGVFEPLRSAIERAAERHRTLFDESGLAAPDASELDPQELWQAIRTYRRAVRNEIMEPLRDSVTALAADRDWADRWRDLYASLDALAHDVPETLTREEPEDLFEATDEDRWWHRLRKAQTRTARRLRGHRRRSTDVIRRLAGRAMSAAPTFAQEVPLGTLTRYHVRVRLREALNGLYGTAHQVLATPVARLESALTAWTHQLLQIERRLDRPRYHLPESVSGMLGAAPNDTPTADTVAAALADAQTQGRLLTQALDDAATSASIAAVATTLEQARTTSWATFVIDVDRAGTFMLPLEQRTVPDDTPGIRDDETEAWSRWFDEAAARLRLNTEMLQFSVVLEELQGAFVGRVVEQGVMPILEAHDRAASDLRSLRAEAAAALDEIRDAATMRTTLDDLQQRSLATVEDELLDRLQAHQRQRPLQQIADDAIRAWLDAIQTLPATLRLHPLQPRDEPVDAVATPRRDVRPRETAEQALDALLLEQLRVAVEPLQETTDRAVRELNQIPSIVRFNLEAASEDLPMEGIVTDDAARDTRELALNGLDRPVEVLTTERSVVLAAVPAVVQTTTTAFGKGWNRVHERLRVEDRVHEQFLDLRTRLAAATRRLWRRTQTGAERGGALTRRLLRLGRRRATELVRIGQSAVGTAAVTEAERRQALTALANADALVRHFPLVYRRLFTFQPVADADLLAGRQNDLDRVSDHVDQWHDHLAGALLLTGPRDCGLTSFLHVVRKTVLTQMTVHTIEIEERVRSETAFAERIAEVLELPNENEIAWTLDRLTEALEHRMSAPRTEAILVEHLEHLFLRTVGGTHLLEDVLTFMSRTDGHLLWIGTITEYGARFVRKTEPATAGIVRWHPLAPLSPDALEQLVMRRHRRSGLPLIFEASPDLNPLLRRRLGRARSEADRQALLRTAYFERLHRLSGQSITLALFYWLRSADLDVDHQLLRIHPVEPLRLNFLADFDLELAFTLKAFLDHTTLTLHHHSKIFRTTLADSRQRFEALSNVLLIEAHTNDDDRSSVGPAITDEGCYRLRPLTIHPVTQYLRGRHIAY